MNGNLKINKQLIVNLKSSSVTGISTSLFLLFEFYCMLKCYQASYLFISF